MLADSIYSCFMLWTWRNLCLLYCLCYCLRYCFGFREIDRRFYYWVPIGYIAQNLWIGCMLNLLGCVLLHLLSGQACSDIAGNHIVDHGSHNSKTKRLTK